MLLPPIATQSVAQMHLLSAAHAVTSEQQFIFAHVTHAVSPAAGSHATLPELELDELDDDEVELDELELDELDD
jgi:hypothetical protein